MAEALRRRVPFVSSEDDDEDVRVLDEQEQEELIQSLKEKSAKAEWQYNLLLKALITLSFILHVIYLNKNPLSSPIEALFPSDKPSPPIPVPSLFAILHLVIHQILVLQLISPANPFRAALNRTLPVVLTHGYSIAFAATPVAPLFALLVGGGWQDVVWWSTAGALSLFVYSAQNWGREEAESIRQLEKLRYAAKGA